VSHVHTKTKPVARPKNKSGQGVKRAGTRTRGARSARGFEIAAAVVAVVAFAAVAAVVSGSRTTANDPPASLALVKTVTSVPKAVFDRVGVGTADLGPKPLNAPSLNVSGKPWIVYMGAEYCPYCATERWPMVIALSRFGTFTGLKTTHSSTTDVFPDTQTFSFHGATYTSRWIDFTGVELQSNHQQGDGYASLDIPTTQEQQLLETYDRAPYVGSGSSSGGIPFIDFAGKFLIGGVTYDPTVLQGKSAGAIADALADPTTKVSQGAVGAANTFTAAICSITHNQPGNVCADPMIQQIAATFGADRVR
jgi:hypothetical protein